MGRICAALGVMGAAGALLSPASALGVSTGDELGVAAGVHECPRVPGLNPSNEQGAPGVSHVSVRNLSCSAADRAIRRGRIYTYNTGSSAPGYGFTYNMRTPGYKCHTVNGGEGAATIRCTHGGKAIRFTYAT
jgi:hypothetical protein